MSHKSCHKPSNLQWLDIADLLLGGAHTINQFSTWLRNLSGRSPAALHNQQILTINDQRLTNLRIDARLKEQRAAKLSNEVVKTDIQVENEQRLLTAKIKALELKNLERELKLKAAGAFNPTFQAAEYPEPGDVRRGKMYE